MNIVLVEPEIPQNTGNIARTCAATGATLHLIKPLGFSIDEKSVRRAGLDYWNMVDLRVYENLEEFFVKNPGGPYVYATTKAQKHYAEVAYTADAYLIFGKETKGLPEDMLREHPERCARVPMRHGARSLNLSNAVAVVLYEALRQTEFAGLDTKGKFPN